MSVTAEDSTGGGTENPEERKQKLYRRIRALAYPVVLAVGATILVCTVPGSPEKYEYRIIDGETSVEVSSVSSDVETVLRENGVDIDEVWYTEELGGSVREIRINRSCEVTVRLYGEEDEYTAAFGTPAGELLASLNVELTSRDAVSCALTDRVYEEMTIVVTRTEYEYETEETAIPAGIKYVDSPYMIDGRERVMAEGSDGLMETVYQSTMVNGEERERRVVSERVMLEPRDTIVASGSRTGNTHDYSDTRSAAEGAGGVVVTPDGVALSYLRELEMTATAYTYDEERPWMDTASNGEPVQVGLVAALPGTLEQGTLVYIAGSDGSWVYGVAIVGDRPGGDIIDLFMEDYDECMQFGRKQCRVYVLSE